ncbi:alginate lyase family protein [Rhodoligotrophos defluvii]|uniref:alginate lyase family protein n=1 Tax=Rhodoligotrophos defluvii TaxID=2561934 RepID=UPI001485820F|nr:alginate lyase family protein [Rhodoligotrophos defluvii]
MLLIPLLPGTVWANPTCKLALPPSQPLKVEGFYADSQGSVVDGSKRAARDKAVAPYEAFVRLQQQRADAYLVRGDEAAGRCALDNLALWAERRALTGRWSSRQANYERNWYLGALALAYLKVMALADPSERARIARWLEEMAAPIPDFLARDDVPENNLAYWAGLAMAATALATGDGRLRKQADGILAQGLAAIAPDGTLPLEMERGGKALDYHCFAAAPLAAMAFMAKARGDTVDFASLKRLGERIIAGLRDPSSFAAMAGAPQESPPQWNLAWFGFYGALVPTDNLPPHAANSHFLGGDVAATMQAIKTATRRDVR